MLPKHTCYGIALVLLACASPAIGIQNGKEVTAHEQMLRGLVSVEQQGRLCSGVLISEDWVLTAGHCVPVDRPNPSVVVRGAWHGSPPIPERSDAIYQFGNPYNADRNPGPDVALIHLLRPFPGIDVGYRLQLYQGSVGSLSGQKVALYGQGSSTLAEKNPAAGRRVPVDGAGIYRAADFRVAVVETDLLKHGPNELGQVTMPGDSGGPLFIWSEGLALLVGINRGGGWYCFEKTPNLPPGVQDGRCYGTITEIINGVATAIPGVRTAIEAVLRTKWNPSSTSEPVWIFGPEIQVSQWRISDLNAVHWAQAARAATQLCYNRGFVTGHFDGHQDVTQGGYGIQCSGRGAIHREATAINMNATQWGFTDVNQVNWAQANRAAVDICNTTVGNFAGGHFTGHMKAGNFGLVCYKDGAQYFDATDKNLSDTGFGFPTPKLDDNLWAQAARAATGFCRSKGFSGGFLTGNQSPNQYGVVCQK